MPPAAQAVLDFWFGAPGDPHFCERREIWFKADAAFDATVHAQCAALHRAAAAGRLDDWAGASLSCLALLLLLDQVPRNLFRRDCAAYAADAKARAVARAALAAGFDARLHPVQRTFVYLPFEHSEDLDDQRLSVALFEALPPEHLGPRTLTIVRRHHEIVARFGRFPHRNACLGRVTTPEEAAFLLEPDSSF